ncbi:MAG: acylneuraminate cytidylyltransferase family protein [bacterium]|nr:acylneuraminate cytidylyltransferase family protein [bacterium]
MESPKVLAVITARAGSKALPGKNIKLLGGKPLIAYSIYAAKQSRLLSDVIVSTDGEEIAAIARAEGADVPFLRPAELSTDETTHIPVMQHAITFMENKLGKRYDYVVILQPTSPFRFVDDIDLTLKKLIERGADSAVTIYEVEAGHHPIKFKTLEKDDRIKPWYGIHEPSHLRQGLPLVYKRSSAVYAMRRDLIMDGKLYGDHVVGHIVPQDRSIDIDTAIDWVKAEYMLEQLKKYFDF